jgi:peptidyl-prolyl cis-trans isomerase C
MLYSRLKESFQAASIIAFIFSFSACHVSNHSGEETAITVGSKNIKKAELKEDIEHIRNEMGISDQEMEPGIRSIINTIVEKYLILEYGKKMDIEISDDELTSSIKELMKDYPEEAFKDMLLKGSVDYDSWKEDFRRKMLIEKITQKAIGDVTPITFDETQTYYNSHKGEFRHLQRVRLRQIVVQTREEAEKILSRLAAGEDMGQLAEKYSITPEAKGGGMMGWIEKGELEEDVEDVIFSLPRGKRSDILKSPYGYHIFEVMDVRGEGYDSLPEVMKEIESRLTLQKKELSYSKWISDLKDHFPVKIEEDIYESWSNK